MSNLLPIPPFFDPHKVGEVWRVPYAERALQAQNWVQTHDIHPVSSEQRPVCLLLIDVQNTFCIPGFELFVGGRSGLGAVEDNTRLCEFIYRHLGLITEIVATMDTHTACQIFHPVFWVDQHLSHPQTATMITYADVLNGIWQVNREIAFSLKLDYEELQKYALHYVKNLQEKNKFPLIVWPYHSMLGGIGHALVSAVEEAIFFHNITRNSQTDFSLKGNNPLTENYSVIQPEVLHDQKGKAIAEKNSALMKKLLNFERIIIAGQAKSHCVAWTVADLLSEINAVDPSLAKKVYLLEDCTSAVVIDGVIDYTAQADETFANFASAGMNLITSNDDQILNL